jgi:hypothetical protein
MRPVLAAAALAAALIAQMIPSGAAAFPVDARIDEQVKPNFGILLNPPLYHHHVHYGVWYGRRRGWGRGYVEPYGLAYGAPVGSEQFQPGPPGPPGLPSVTVDCGDPSYGPHPISDAAAYLPDNGVVYVRGHGQACHETIEIDHPVVIAAEAVSAFSTDPDGARVVIAPPPGQPCVLIADGVKQVEIRGFVLSATDGRDASCVEGWNANVALVHDDIDYTGDASAVYVSRGQLILRQSRIDAHTYDAAVTSDGADLDMVQDRIRADTIGLQITLGPAESDIEHVGVLTTHSAGEASVGVEIRGERSGGALLKIRNAVVCGFRVGVGLERGARADIRRSRICHSTYGVMSEGANLEIDESAIGGERFGIYVASGDATISHNRIFNLPDPGAGIFGEPPAGITEDTNWFYVRFGCERFRWDGRRFCLREDELPPSILDDSAFDRDYPDAWDVDGYDLGYTRDGPVVAFAPEPPRHCGLFGCSRPPRRRGPPPRGGGFGVGVDVGGVGVGVGIGGPPPRP